MKALFHDRRAFLLKDLKVGQIAVATTTDCATCERKVYTKIVVPGKFAKGDVPVEMVICLSELSSQYFDNISQALRVVLLEKGESVEFSN